MGVGVTGSELWLSSAQLAPAPQPRGAPVSAGLALRLLIPVLILSRTDLQEFVN